MTGEPCVPESSDLTTVTFLQRKIVYIFDVVFSSLETVIHMIESNCITNEYLIKRSLILPIPTRGDRIKKQVISRCLNRRTLKRFHSAALVVFTISLGDLAVFRID